MRIDYHFDFSCPYAYLGATRIEALATRVGADLRWCPMLLGGVFRAVGTPQVMSAGMAPAKARHNLADMMRWADAFAVQLSIPDGHPRRTVRALRALLALAPERWPAFIREVYAAYWQRGEDIAEPSVVERCLGAVGITGDDAARALAANDDAAIKAELRARTDAAIELGIFGAPGIVVTDSDDEAGDLFWGQDRLHMVEAVARGWRPTGGTPPTAAQRGPSAASRAATDAPTLDFFYDFSSPFSYLASTQIEALAARAGARLRWRPMLLGALFRNLGTANVPLAAMSDAKRRYYGRDLEHWASYWGVPFRFTNRFPMRTVTALRLALAAGDRIAEMSHLLYRALWVDDRDLADDHVLRQVLESAGFDPSLVEATREPSIKQALIDSTSEAEARGVFGAPTCVVVRDGTEHLFWGQDRLEMVERALAGWAPPGA